MSDINLDTIQRMWITTLVIYAVVLIVVAVLLALILRAAHEVRLADGQGADQRHADHEQHDQRAGHREGNARADTTDEPEINLEAERRH